MKSLLTILKLFGVCMLIPCFAFAVTLSLYMVKQVKWESNLKHYRKGALGSVINPQGFTLSHASELLDELQGFEEKIAK